MEPTNYASFGRRLAAFLIDALVLCIIIVPIVGMAGFGAASSINPEDLQSMNPEEAASAGMGMMGFGFGLQLGLMLIQGIYFVLMESSAKQATLGKMAMGIKVTDMEGNRITTKAAILRYIGRIVSGMILFIGYIMAAFTAKKQALHDMIANTLVLK